LSAAYDLVVIGGGIAGLTAAGRAAQAGLRVAVLERGTDEAYPCNSRYSGGILHIAFHNIREPASALLEVIDAATRGKAEPKLAKAFADNAARVVDWLRDEGVEFMSVGNIAYQQWVLAPRRPLTPGLDWKGRGADVAMRLLEKNLNKRGGEVFRGGNCWTRGSGRIFYFSPGHELYPIYHNPQIQRVIYNAVNWARPQGRPAEVPLHVPVENAPEKIHARGPIMHDASGKLVSGTR